MHFKDKELESERGTSHSPSPMGNSEFCLPLTLNVLLASENKTRCLAWDQSISACKLYHFCLDPVKWSNAHLFIWHLLPLLFSLFIFDKLGNFCFKAMIPKT